MTSESQKSYQHCNEENDAYYPVCSRLQRLCPRLVPGPLWGLSLANIARMAPQAALTICDSCPRTVERVHRYWTTLNRDSKCEVCGEPGNEIDEDWLYCVFDENGNLVRDIAVRNPTPEEAERYKGVAYLQRLRLLCEKCHLAKHQGYALVAQRFREAVEHLVKVNNANLDVAKELIGKAFRTHSLLSRIEDWTIRIGNLSGLSSEEVNAIEFLLNTMYRRGFFLYQGWLYYQSKNEEIVEEKAIDETVNTVLRAVRDTKAMDGETVVERVIQVLKTELESSNVMVLDRELKLFLDFTMREKVARILNEVKSSRLLERQLVSFIRNLAKSGDLVGKWMVFVPTRIYSRVFRLVLDALEKTGLAYHGKIIARREDYEKREDMPIIIYVPSALSPSIIAGVASILRKVLNELYIYKRLFFKPDIFTQKGIYSKTTKHKPYIYTY